MRAPTIGLPLVRPSRWLLAVALVTVGCGTTGTTEPPPDARTQAEQALRKSDPAMFQKIEEAVRKVVNDATVRYWPLEYDTDERLVDYLDQANKQIAAGASEPSKRYLRHMEPKEELEHIRETIRRWSARTGKDLRATIDDLQADIAHRDPKQTMFPEFHKKFARELSDFIKLENEELHERRDRMIRANLPAALAPYRDSHPAIVREFESRYSPPQVDPPASSRAEPPAEPRKS
jgi:hypothetical protein